MVVIEVDLAVLFVLDASDLLSNDDLEEVDCGILYLDVSLNLLGIIMRGWHLFLLLFFFCFLSRKDLLLFLNFKEIFKALNLEGNVVGTIL
jgi:hypothetical protein